MSDGTLRVLDGMHLRAIDLSLPERDASLTGAQILDIADSRASSSLFGLPAPENLRDSALTRIYAGDIKTFRSTDFGREEASQILKDYITAVADELKGLYLLLLMHHR